MTAGQVPSNPLTAARNKMQALSMKAPGFAAAMAAAEALYEESGIVGQAGAMPPASAIAASQPDVSSAAAPPSAAAETPAPAPFGQH